MECISLVVVMNLFRVLNFHVRNVSFSNSDFNLYPATIIRAD
jgi:hypothetical protein